jgi:uncharacterized protein (DUF433 family)
MPTVSIEHIEVDESGTARVVGTRSRVINIVFDTRNGLTPEEVHAAYPHLSLAQIHAALAFYYDHQADLDAQMKSELRQIQSLRALNATEPSRAELLKRLDQRAAGADGAK